MSNLKVLHVLWSAQLGGIARLVLHLCTHQRTTGLASADVLVSTNDGDLKAEFIEAGIEFHELGLRSGLDLNILKLMRCITLMKQYDAIHLHVFHPITSWAAKRSGSKIVFTEHGNFGLHRSPGLRGLLVRRFKSVFLMDPRVKITCNSRFTLNTTNRLYRIPKEKMKVVYNGVPAWRHTVSTDHPAKEFSIVSIGRLARVKRFDRVIEAFMKAGIQNSRLTILGDGPEKTHLKTLAEKVSSELTIEFRTEGNAMALLEQADLCILGSEGEAFGLVAVEAYQAGKRVLVFQDGGGLTEIVNPFDPSAVCRDISTMATAIKTSLQEQSYHTSEWIKSAQKHAEVFSLDKMAREFNRLYQS